MNPVSGHSAVSQKTRSSHGSGNNDQRCCFSRWCVEACHYLGECLLILCSMVFCCCLCNRTANRANTSGQSQLQNVHSLGAPRKPKTKPMGKGAKKRLREAMKRKEEKIKGLQDSDDEYGDRSSEVRRQTRRRKLRSQSTQNNIISTDTTKSSGSGNRLSSSLNGARVDGNRVNDESDCPNSSCATNESDDG